MAVFNKLSRWGLAVNSRENVLRKKISQTMTPYRFLLVYTMGLNRKLSG